VLQQRLGHLMLLLLLCTKPYCCEDGVCMFGVLNSSAEYRLPAVDKLALVCQQCMLLFRL
jgi:hypothetical protein